MARFDEAKQIQFLKRNGMTIPQIADKLATNQQNVRNRLKLTPEEQMRVHTGKLGMVNANKLVVLICLMDSPYAT